MQRIGLSATQRPLDTIARFLGGTGPGREVTIVDAGARKPLDLQVVVPVDDMAALGEILPLEDQPGGPASGRGDMRTSIWPAIHPRILELIRSHRSTIVFTNSRRLSERLAQRLNELAGEELVRAHHGSDRPRAAASRSRRRSRTAGSPRWSPRPASSSASTWARSTSSSRSRARPASPAGCSASAGRATRSARPARASSSRSTAATCSNARSSPAGCTKAPSRRPASRATRSTSSPSSSWR